jgi:hypothetical protein
MVTFGGGRDMSITEYVNRYGQLELPPFQDIAQIYSDETDNTSISDSIGMMGGATPLERQICAKAVLAQELNSVVAAGGDTTYLYNLLALNFPGLNELPAVGVVISPSVAGPGFWLTLTATSGLATLALVTFGYIGTRDFQVVSDTEARVKVPFGISNMPVTVIITNAGGNTVSSPLFSYSTELSESSEDESSDSEVDPVPADNAVSEA